MWSSGSTNPQNNEKDDTFDDKEHDFDAKKPESEVILSPSSSTQSRKQDDKTKKEAKGKSHVESLESDGEMCMFALTVSHTEPKNIKEAMADSVWIESMQEELYQFDRLDVWELVDRPLCKNVISTSEALSFE
nr:Gag-Pol polyprotein [Tanacetum cinerariifolium]